MQNTRICTPSFATSNSMPLLQIEPSACALTADSDHGEWQPSLPVTPEPPNLGASLDSSLMIDGTQIRQIMRGSLRQAFLIAADEREDRGGERRTQILVRMTHRHLAIFRTRVKPYRAYNSSGPVCR